MFYIYIIQNLKNDKVYIGQTIQPRKILSYHLSKLSNGLHFNSHLQNAYNQNGKDYFIHFILGEYSTEYEVDDAERFYISWYKSLALCYNLESGGNTFKKHSDESISKVKEARKKQVFTEEHRKRMSESHKGKPSPRKGCILTEEQNKKLQLGKQKYLLENGHPRKGIKDTKEQIESKRLRTLGTKQSEETIRKRTAKLAGKDRGGIKYTAFGEEKTISQWSLDERCEVKRTTLKQRIQKYGWETERSLRK